MLTESYDLASNGRMQQMQALRADTTNSVPGPNEVVSNQEVRGEYFSCSERERVAAVVPTELYDPSLVLGLERRMKFECELL